MFLDMAMTQFSYGKLEDYNVHGKELPLAGGFDRDGNLTKNPADILDTMRALSIGYWKGAGLSLLLDLMAGTLSGGDMTHEIRHREAEYGVSQLFMAFDLKSLTHSAVLATLTQQAIEFYKNSIPDDSDVEIRYPGERILHTRNEHRAHGIPIAKTVWNQIRQL